MSICWDNANLFKIQQKYRAHYVRNKVRLLLPVILNRNENSAVDLNSTGQLGEPRRYKHDANPPQ